MKSLPAAVDINQKVRKIKIMKITVFVPKEEFTQRQQDELASLGEVVYTDSRNLLPLKELQK